MKPLTLEETVTAVDTAAESPPAAPHTWPSCNVTGVATDSRQVRPGDLFFAIRGQNHDGHAFVAGALGAGAVAAVVRRGFRRPDDVDESAILIETDEPTHALGRLARFHRRQLSADVVAVTGSNGKTTTKEMIAHVLGGRWAGRCSIKSYNNEIGVPLTLLSADAADRFVVVEVGTNAPGEIAALAALIEPEVAVVTGVAPVHLERLESIEGIAAEKLSLLRYIRPGGCAIVNIDTDAARHRLAEIVKGPNARSPSVGGLPKGVKIVTIGRSEEADLRLTSLRADDARGDASAVSTPPPIEFEVNSKFRYRLNLLGPHNAMNALAAIAVARRFGLEHGEIAERLATFSLPSMRLEHRRLRWRSGSRKGEIDVIVDAYNANPASVAAAIDVLRSYPRRPDGRRVIVLGDMRELGPRAGEFHDEIARKVAAGGIDMFLAVGSQAKRMAKAARESRKANPAQPDMEVHAMASTQSAVRRVGPLCRPGDVVLVKGSRAMGLEQLVEALAKRAE